MFSKCVYNDKLHLCTSNDKLNWSMSSLCLDEQLCEAILPLIPEDSRLKDLFLRWSTLGPAERAAIDEQVDTPERIDLYTPLKEAMSRWEAVQETQGAPGFDQGVYSFSCDSQLEEELVSVIFKVETLVDTVKSQTMFCETHSTPNFSSGSGIISFDSPVGSSHGWKALKTKPYKSASVGNITRFK